MRRKKIVSDMARPGLNSAVGTDDCGLWARQPTAATGLWSLEVGRSGMVRWVWRCPGRPAPFLLTCTSMALLSVGRSTAARCGVPLAARHA